MSTRRLSTRYLDTLDAVRRTGEPAQRLLLVALTALLRPRDLLDPTAEVVDGRLAVAGRDVPLAAATLTVLGGDGPLWRLLAGSPSLLPAAADILHAAAPLFGESHWDGVWLRSVADLAAAAPALAPAVLAYGGVPSSCPRSETPAVDLLCLADLIDRHVGAAGYLLSDTDTTAHITFEVA